MQTRRDFLRTTAGGLALATGLRAQDAPRLEHTLSVIEGTPRERGRAYGQRFKASITRFLEREIYAAFDGKPNQKELLLRYGGACSRKIKDYAPLVMDEMEGMAEGAGLRLEEIVLVTNHEELWHRGAIKAVDHCTVFGAAPPDTADGETYVAQTWDWMESVYGLSSMLLWKRAEGPSVLAYAYPGLWTGAGVNSEGVSLCWHSGSGDGKEPAVGIPAYVLIAQMLYQPTLKGALEELRRATQAGWFVFLLGDAQGSLATVRGTPKKVDIRPDAVANGGRRRAQGDAKVDLAAMQAHCPTVKVKTTIDAMVFSSVRKEAHVTRRAGGATPWLRFGFDSKPG